MVENKTKATEQSVEDFLAKTENPQKKADSFELLTIMEEISGTKAKMWGESIVGFGNYHYKYESGREGDFLMIGFSPRKSAISLYLMCGIHNNQDLLEQLGKHKIGKSCLYINQLADINIDILKKLIKGSLNETKRIYPNHTL